VIQRPERRPRSAVDGVLLLDKPPGVTSQKAVSRVKALFNAAKAGHTGTLDPMATGLLPIAFGEATKFSAALLDATKSYVATVRLGQTTTTGDLEGEVTLTCPVTATLTDIEAVLPQFRGEILQTPPMYSALKRDGKPLYEYARQGVDLPREPRGVSIGELRVEGYDGTELRISVSCSKGTYIRVLAEDIGRALGCGACLSALRRTRVGHLRVDRAASLQALEACSEAERRARLLPVDAMLVDLPVVELDDAGAERLTTGMAVQYGRSGEAGLVRVYAARRGFLGLAFSSEGRLQPRRMVAAGAANLEKTPTYRVE
jgi:tRNA pseudouridine55 synthase